MKLAKLVRGGPHQSCHPPDQEHGSAIVHTLALSIQHLARERDPARSFRELDGEVDSRALVLISKVPGAWGRPATHPSRYGGPKAIKYYSRNPHAPHGRLPRSWG